MTNQKRTRVCSNPNTKRNISELPDELVLKILSFLSTKHAVATSLLSKRWKSVWTMVPRLKYEVKGNSYRSERFLDESLFAHQSHFLESISLTIDAYKDIGPWIRTALHHHHCHLREIKIDANYIARTKLPPEMFTCKTLVVLKLKGIVMDVVEPLTTVCLPSLETLHVVSSSRLFDSGSLRMLLSSCNVLTDLIIISKSTFYDDDVFDVSWCKTLVSLKLEGFKDVIMSRSNRISSPEAPTPSSLPFLKTLHASRMVNSKKDSFRRLLSNCPLLSDLALEEKTSRVLLNSDIAMPCLQRLSIITKVKDSTHLCKLLNSYISKLATIAPSFKYFDIHELLFDTRTCFCARVRLTRDPSTLEDARIFLRIVHLEMCIRSERSGKMLVHLLQCFINLKVLKLIKHVYEQGFLYVWEPPRSVPECLLSSLEVLEWRGYTGVYGDRELVSYLLNHALCLKTAKISSEPYVVGNKQQTLKDLAAMSRGSKPCELVLN
ncbi:unnamed protein product [Microthlaspi erraticum]|uniref:F-box domain-containing protein n=1 Tax=Microthlaspi erraticum TaxID=1685480 RepID=A0A6D2L1V1_9BRAS|nr:unnamed protein product [Microthlaspi erraticum]